MTSCRLLGSLQVHVHAGIKTGVEIVLVLVVPSNLSNLRDVLTSCGPSSCTSLTPQLSSHYLMPS